MASRPNVVRRLRRGLLAAAVAACVAVPLAGAARPTAVPAPAPAALGPLTAGGGQAELTQRYTANRADILAAQRLATRYGDPQRATELAELARTDRQFLSFDGRDGGRTVEVFGDLATARTVAVYVPGSDTNLGTYDRFATGAQALEQQLGGDAAHAAVVAWLGYATPDTVSPVVLTDGRADRAAPQLQDFVRRLAAFVPEARTSVICHSYGSTVCARAAAGLDVADIVLYGSPGVGSDLPNVSGLHTKATVWAGRASGDWIAGVPHVRVPILFTTLGLGTDPVTPGFGAHLFAAGTGGHSDYLKPGSVPLRSIAAIVSGAADRAPSI
ncbi:alpha/beta hydrolase [Streptacidiphilus melanogenes]|uniref:alpha/beta hydrolase n=1 Tax=Streptacidiphilus melanogenes TaxID=411235 RepID=UPI0005A618B5|nr:alpha/beta hydrolase [Streptacidiphilus melanogenes]